MPPEHSCGREHPQWSLWAANRCDGCALAFLAADGELISLARACTGLDMLPSAVASGSREPSGINYEGVPSPEQRARATRLWRMLHGCGE